jgi:hypothetical protein
MWAFASPASWSEPVRRVLCALLILAAVAAGAQQEEEREPAPAKVEQKDAAEQGPARADRPAPGKAADAKEEPDEPRQDQVPEEFNPTEQVSEDLSTSFPVDI